MTLAGLKAAKKEFDALKAILPRSPTPHDKLADAWLASLTPEETARLASILVRADRGTAPTPEEIGFTRALVERPVPPMPAINREQPRCHLCGRQPATVHNGMLPICERCYDAVSGADVSMG